MLGGILGLLFLGVLVATGFLLREALVIFFHFKKSFRTIALGSLFAFLIVSWLSGAAVLFWQISYFAIACILAATLAISALLFFIARRNAFPDEFVETKKVELMELPQSKHWFIILSYLILAGVGFYLLAISRTGGAILSPWQTINKYFIYVFALATFVLAMSIVTRMKTNWLLGLLIVHSLLLHSYLPLTHDLFYGADGWRHLATENNLLAGSNFAEPTISDRSSVSSLLSNAGRVAYSQLWGTSILIAKISGLNLMTLNKWLMPILWSLFIPLLLFEIGRSLGWSRRLSLVFVWLSFLPFAWQVSGAFTLPVNLGFISWLALVLLIFKRAENPESSQVWILVAAGILSLFSYSLFVLLFWLSFLIFELINWKEDFSWPMILLITLLVAMVLPLFEWQFGSSGLWPTGSLLGGLKQFLGNFTAYYLAAGPRPHDISVGNVIFNQTPGYSFVANYFTFLRWWLVAFMVGFWGFVIVGLRAAHLGGLGSLPRLSGNLNENPSRSHLGWFLIITCGIYLSYIVTRYWLPGEHLLTRRLDVVLAFLFITLFTLGLSQIPFSRRTKPLVAVGFLILSITVAASYSLGPDTNTNSNDEFAAMKYVWEMEKGEEHHCVIADVYPLLALETISNSAIIGGGFPISHNFEQPELSQIFAGHRDASILDVRNGINNTGASRCWILVSPGAGISSFISSSPAATSTSFGEVKLWSWHN
ncbi:MAG: hypothetical protein AAB467_03345 [Patescibacteria group bacterium]